MSKLLEPEAFSPVVEVVAVSSLVPYAKNARTHDDSQIDQIAASITEFGWTSPILINAEGGIIAGHGRVLAAQLLSMAEVPAIRLSHLTAAQERALVIADNRIALNAGWDESLLAAELAALDSLDFDLSLTGFDMSEIERLIKNESDPRDPDDTPDAPDNPVSRIGDIWILGRHRVMCGSSTDLGDLEKAIGGLKVDLACSDPPYGINVVKGTHIGGAKAFGSKGKVHGGDRNSQLDGVKKARERGRVHGPARNAIIAPGTYAPIIGDDTIETAVAHYKALVEMNVSAIVLWGGNYFANALPNSRCWLIWDKENTGSFADAELAWTNQDKIVQLLRHQWSGLIKASERGEKRVHPTQKPVALAEWVYATVTPTAKTVLDGFLGSGWTLIAAERTGRTCVGLELSPAYVDVAVERWQAFTGSVAILESTRQTFAELAEERLAPADLLKDAEAGAIPATS